jgi:hypothetical protein
MPASLFPWIADADAADRFIATSRFSAPEGVGLAAGAA